MLLADLRHDLVRTFVRAFPMADYAELNRVVGELRAEGRERLHAAGVPDDRVECSAHLDLRYAGQQWTLTVPAGGDAVSKDTAPALRAAFNALYEVRFGHSFTNIPSEVVNVRVIAVGRRPKPEFPPLPGRRSGAPAATRRPVHMGAGAVDTAVYRREDLLRGDRIAGPAVIEEASATTLVGPGDTAELSEHGFIVIHIKGNAR
jgi:N-methylhydantoinase A